MIIIGGGIGASALACIMADAGWEVLVLEKQPQYEDRVRGEWIAPWGVVETQTLGPYDLRLVGINTPSPHSEKYGHPLALAVTLPFLHFIHQSVTS